MADKPHSRTREMLRGSSGATAEQPIEEPTAPNGAAPPDPEKTDERGMRRQTLYLPPGVYEHLRDTCYTTRKSQQALFREIFDFYFRAHGGKSWDELKRESPPKKKATA